MLRLISISIINTDVQLQLKHGAEHQQSLPDHVVEERLHHPDDQGALRHQDQQVGGFVTQCKVGWVRHLSIRMRLANHYNLKMCYISKI